MRIGIIAGEYPPKQGGVGDYTRILARHLVNAGATIHILTTPGAHESDGRIMLGTRIKDWNWRTGACVRTWAHECELDIVNLQYQTAAFGMSPFIHFLPDAVDIPFVTTFHDLRFPYLFPKAGFLRSRIVRHLAFHSDGVIVTNHEDAASLSKQSQRALIPIGSNILTDSTSDDSSDARAQAGAKDDDFLVVYFGLFNASKGLDTLIEAASRVRDGGIPLRLLLIGGAGSSDPTNIDYAQRINAAIDRYGLERFTHRAGFLTDDKQVAEFLHAADCVALPFRDGASFRRGSLLAAIHQCAAIITTTPNTPIPAFGEGEPMVFIPPDDVGALADALMQLATSPERRDLLRANVQKLKLLFDWKHIAADTMTFFERIIDANKAQSQGMRR